MNIEIDVVTRPLTDAEAVVVRYLYRQLAPTEKLSLYEMRISAKPPQAIILARWPQTRCIMGMVFFAPYYRDVHEWGYIWNLIIHRCSRRKGIGSHLVSKAVELTRQADKRHLLAKTDTPEGRQFFATIGFVPGDAFHRERFRDAHLPVRGNELFLPT